MLSFFSYVLQIGISFQPAEVQRNVYASVIEDMILKVRSYFTMKFSMTMLTQQCRKKNGLTKVIHRGGAGSDVSVCACIERFIAGQRELCISVYVFPDS